MKEELSCWCSDRSLYLILTIKWEDYSIFRAQLDKFVNGGGIGKGKFRRAMVDEREDCRQIV